MYLYQITICINLPKFVFTLLTQYTSMMCKTSISCISNFPLLVFKNQIPNCGGRTLRWEQTYYIVHVHLVCPSHFSGGGGGKKATMREKLLYDQKTKQ